MINNYNAIQMKSETTESVSLYSKNFTIAAAYDGHVTISALQDYLPLMEDELYNKLKDDFRAVVSMFLFCITRLKRD